MLGNIINEKLMPFTFEEFYVPQLQASSGPTPRMLYIA